MRMRSFSYLVMVILMTQQRTLCRQASQAYLAQNDEDNIAKVAYEVGPNVTYTDASSIYLIRLHEWNSRHRRAL
ncbi:unnamed protein product [Bursaphelenchus xylophilus]|uniref:(pine wood nematode) hypothetical protein n=1 Tax=Bursaphelenchus xylophilus TaxID=6326 RepID=A0A7I8WVC6_BURXY|nr:unnamed protein product [Bursaphelenchus xylophilus]CAG9117565.1 unnamed protein product [Bursaphelenchus xylophilus]